MRKLPEKEFEQIIRGVEATQSIEGLICTEADRERMRQIGTGLEKKGGYCKI